MLPESAKTKISTPSALFLSFAMILTLSACGGGSSGTATVTSVTISPTSGTVQINTTFQISAMVALSNNTSTTDTAVTWQVNGVGGGNSLIGTIVTDPADDQVGIYTAPASTPTTNNGQVNITATVPQNPSNTTDTNIVTSNTAIITVGVGEGLAVSPGTATVPAGGTFQFSALLNSVADSNATWSVASTNVNCTTNACIGSIDRVTGLYTAPPAPPPGATITVTATDSTVNPVATATATATIAYSDLSLNGPFAFSYSGNDQTGFFAAVGSFVADGNGHIVSGIEDVDSFTTGGWVQYQISSTASTYKVGPDGRTTVKLNTGLLGASTWQFALTSNQHAVMIRFDRSSTGSGTIDQQNLNDISNLAAITGPYVFSGSGTDLSFLPLGLAGKFTASGSSSLQTGTGVVDLNDNGAVNQAGSLTASYSLDNTAPDTGRGKLTLTSAALSQRQFAFYIVDATHLYLIEIDGNAYMAGNMYSGAPGASFSSASLTADNYAFTTGGNSSGGSYASGGVFTSGGNGTISGGVFDSNNAGTVTSDVTLGSCAYSVDPATGRIVLNLCPGTASVQFAMYQTAQAASTTVEPSAVMLELDSTALSTGFAYLQAITTEPTAGGFAMLLGGQGVFHSNPGAYQQDVDGQVILSATTVTSGNLDINNFNAVFLADPLSSTSSSITAPVSPGRGMALLVGTDPNVSYTLAFYAIDDNTALLLDLDKTFVLVGSIARQF
jgi:hypothetical protein